MTTINNPLLTLGNSGFSVRLKNCLSSELCGDWLPEKLGISPLSGWKEARDYPLLNLHIITDQEFMRMPNFGKVCLKEVRAVIKYSGEMEMASPNKLIGKDIKTVILYDFQGSSHEVVWLRDAERLCIQLAAVMRENQQLKDMLENRGVAFLNRNKQSETKALACKNCGQPIKSLEEEKNCFEYEEAVNKAFSTKTP